MRRHVSHLAATVVLGAVAATGIAPQESPAPGAPPGQGPYVKGADLALLQEVRDVARRVERIVGRRLGTVIAVRAGEETFDSARGRRVASWGLESHLPPRGRAWADIGLGDEGTPSALLWVLASDLPGMVLDPVGPRLLVRPDLMSPRDFEAGAEAEAATTVLLATGVRPDETLVAHSLVHLLQSGREDRSRPPETTDRFLARAAWDEGEAGLVAVLYLFEGLGLRAEVLEGRLDPGEVLGGRLLPDVRQVRSRATQNLLEFVFREGFFRAAGITRAGGMEALQNAARERPTTRDLLHPDRSPLAAKREETEMPAAPPAMRLLDRDQLGEQAIVALVSALTGKDNLALVAGDGWEGDALFRWEPADGTAPASGVTLWITRWASGNDAEEFEFAWRRCLEARFPAGRAVGAGEGSQRMEAGDRTFTWSRTAEELRVRVAPGTESSGSEPRPDVPTRGRIQRKL